MTDDPTVCIDGPLEGHTFLIDGDHRGRHIMIGRCRPPDERAVIVHTYRILPSGVRAMFVKSVPIDTYLAEAKR